MSTMRVLISIAGALATVSALTVPVGPANVRVGAASVPVGAANVPVMRAGPAPAVRTAAAGVAEARVVCTVRDDRLHELSGLVTTRSGYVAINDSNDDPDAMRIFFLNSRCQVSRSVGYPTSARDPEDLAIDDAGTIWVGDIGDNETSNERRTTVAVWRLKAGADAPTLYRLRYTDGPHDAEALLITGEGVPVIITKELVGAAGIYVPTAALKANSSEGVALRKVGEFLPKDTGTPNPYDRTGTNLVTGAASAPDGRRVVVRTYADAYEFDVADGDVIGALTTFTPRVTALPEEVQGEAIAYSQDGESFLTASDDDKPTPMRAYQPAARPAVVPTPTPAVSSSIGVRDRPKGTRAPPWWPVFAVVVGAMGILVFFAGVIGLRRSRRR